jgi:hypothetical protein
MVERLSRVADGDWEPIINRIRDQCVESSLKTKFARERSGGLNQINDSRTAVAAVESEVHLM